VGDRIGRIVRLQVQARSLKEAGTYDPTPILASPVASIDAGGMLLWNGTGWIIDAHHRLHPRSRGRGNRPLSIGFTGHYRAMSAEFGGVPVGIAGENIIVDGPALRMDDLGDGVVIRTRDGREIMLGDLRPAEPCLPFTSFLVGSDEVLPRAAIAGEMAFLSGGTRGFLATVDPDLGHAGIGLGDEVYFPPR
jgi:hypothetical protein